MEPRKDTVYVLRDATGEPLRFGTSPDDCWQQFCEDSLTKYLMLTKAGCTVEPVTIMLDYERYQPKKDTEPTSTGKSYDRQL